jgi:enoyl-CoA hydratase
MDSTGISIERSGKIAVVSIDRSDDLNSLSLDMMHELTEVALTFQDDPETLAVILTGGPNAFSAGIDLRDPKLQAAFSDSIGRRRQALMIGPKMCRAWESMEQITICAIEGHCVGGALALAVSCDFRIAGRGARLKVPELKLGLNMSWQSIPRMVRLVGPARTKQIVLLAEEMGAEQAFEWGVVQEVTEGGGALAAATAMAEKVAAMPPIPVKMTKQAVNAVTNALNDATSYMDTDQSILCTLTEDHKEGVLAFLGRKEPSFKGE